MTLHRLLLSGIVLLALSQTAWGSVDQVSVEQVWTVGRYVEATGFMEGSVSGRPYSVPVTLLYPTSHGNGVGLVDCVNNANFVYFFAGEAVPFGRLQMGDEFIMRQGYSYMSIQFEKLVTANDQSARSHIGEGTDGYTIVKDAADFLRQPVGRLAGLLEHPEPPEAGTVLAYGYSRSAGFLRGFVEKNDDGTFDGILLGGGGAIALQLVNSPPYSHLDWDVPALPASPLYVPPPLPRNGKVMMLQTETELEAIRAVEERGPNEVVYEVAGVAHAPSDIADMRALPWTLVYGGLNYTDLGIVLRQNPASFGPAIRGAMSNLTNWVVRGVAPPPSALIAGQPAPPVAIGPYNAVPDFPGSFELYGTRVGWSFLYFSPERDSNGNALGGVRLPHVEAPIGTYGGSDQNPILAAIPVFGAVVFLGGTFTPFSPAKLRELYRNHGAYVSAVAHAADEALRQRWIIQEDRDRFVSEAARSNIGK